MFLSFIEKCRTLFSSRGESRTRTRSKAGGVSTRLGKGYEAANSFCIEDPRLRPSLTSVDNAPVTQTQLIEHFEAQIRLIEL